MLCNNKHCWRCQIVHKKDAEMKKKGFSLHDMGELGRGYTKVDLNGFKILEVSGGGGGGGLPIEPMKTKITKEALEASVQARDMEMITIYKWIKTFNRRIELLENKQRPRSCCGGLSEGNGTC